MTTSKLHKISLAILFYLGVCAFVFYPARTGLDFNRLFIIANLLIASIAVFLLCARWINSFAASLLAGLLFGFSPFALGLFCYHPAAVIAYTMLPICFWPAAFLPDSLNFRKHSHLFASAILSLLPFLMIAFYFQLLSRIKLTPIPLTFYPDIRHILSFVSPLAVKPHDLAFSFYCASVPAVIMAAFILAKIRRISIVLILAVSIALSLCQPIFAVPPIFWLSASILVIAIAAGVGSQAVVLANRSDRNYLLAAALITAAFAVISFVLARQTSAVMISAKMYSLVFLAVLIIYFLSRSSLPVRAGRWIILSAAFAVDFLIISRILLAKIF